MSPDPPSAGGMPEATPRLQLETLFLFDARGRIVSTRESRPSPGPMFSLIRGVDACAWAVHSTVGDELAKELHDLASREPPSDRWLEPPTHADRYQSLLGGHLRWGPAFAFPDGLGEAEGVTVVDDVAQLDEAFEGWTADELAGRSPVVGVVADGRVVSICFCARRSEAAAEAGVETLAAYRGKGFGPRVTTAWAQAVRASGRTPIYSTWWENAASMAVAKRLGLRTFAVDWGLTAPG